MTRNERIIRVLRGAEHLGVADSFYAALSAAPCDGSTHHSPRPLLTYPLNLTTDDDPDWVSLCATCRDNLSAYLLLMVGHDGFPPEAVKRDFGNIIRELGDRSWPYASKFLKERADNA